MSASQGHKIATFCFLRLVLRLKSPPFKGTSYVSDRHGPIQTSVRIRNSHTNICTESLIRVPTLEDPTSVTCDMREVCQTTIVPGGFLPGKRKRFVPREKAGTRRQYKNLLARYPKISCLVSQNCFREMPLYNQSVTSPDFTKTCTSCSPQNLSVTRKATKSRMNSS